MRRMELSIIWLGMRMMCKRGFYHPCSFSKLKCRRRDGYIHVDYYASLAQDGTAHFWTRFRNANDFFDQRYALVCGLRDAATGQPGHVFSMSRGGSLGPRKKRIDSQDTVVAEVSEYWDNIITGDMTMDCQVKGDFDLGAWFDKMVELWKTYGPITGEIIALISG